MGLNLVSSSFMSAAGPSPNRLPRRQPAIFLDAAVVFAERTPGSDDLVNLRLRPGAATALRALGMLDCRLVLIGSPNAGAPGPLQVPSLPLLNLRMSALFGDCGAVLAGCYSCLHERDETGRRACLCRRPMPGLLLRASAELRLRISASWLVGGLLDDIESGRRAGCRTVLLGGAGETEWRHGPGRMPHYFVGSLVAVAHLIADVRRIAARHLEPESR